MFYDFRVEPVSFNEEEGGTPPGTPPRRKRAKRKARRRSPSSSTSADESAAQEQRRKTSSRLSTKDVLEMLMTWKGENSKATSLNNNNMNNVVPEFDPFNGAQTIDCWLRKVNECAIIYGWNEKQTIHFSLQKLTGLAKKWFEGLPTIVYSWDEWQSKLKKAFPSEENYARLLEEMLNRTSRNDEHMREYFYDKLGLLTRCEIQSRKAVDCIVYGITDKSVRNGAQALNCTEPEDLLHFLCSQKLQPFITSNNSKPRDRIVKDSGNATGRYSSNISSVSSSIVCYNCKSKGHPYFKCTKAIVKCKRCNRIGHDKENCAIEPLTMPNSNTRRDDGSNEKKTLKIDTTTKGNDKFYKTVEVNDHSFVGYIDFGSECTLLRKTDAETLKLEKKYDGIPVVKGFGQATVVPLYKSQINLKVDEVDSTIEALIVDDEHLQTPLIIGQDFTELPFVTVLKSHRKLIFYKSPSDDAVNTDEGSLKLYVDSSTDVTKTCAVPIHVGSSYTGDILIEGYTALEPGKEYRLLQGAYRVENGKGEVVVSNLSHNAIKLEQNTILARSIPFTERKICQVNRIVTDIDELNPLEKSDIQVGSELGADQVDRLYTLLQKYRDCFATNLSEIGRVVDVEMKIELMDNKPIVYRPYRLSHSEREQVRETIDDLLKHGVIQESNSSYASPILMVKKKKMGN